MSLSVGTALPPDPFRIFTSEWLPGPGRLPKGHTVCAIGDVHGQLAHLQALTDWLASNVLPGVSGRCDLITLGDYVDRGPANIGVLTFLGAFDPPGAHLSGLLGNHDMFLNTFLHDPSIDFDFIEMWLANGGGATVLELGVENEDFYRYDLQTLQARALERLPAPAARWLDNLEVSQQIGGYVFVHAGVDPRRAVEKHTVEELVMMREPFLSGAGWRHDFVVAHGHTICGPDVKAHRIACDSGAFATGVLSCAQIEADRLRFVIATGSEGPGALAKIAARWKTRAFAWTECEVA